MITLSLLHPLNKNPLQHWTFEKESVVRIGRSTDNDVILYSAVVSRHHVELRRTDKGWEITSLGTNGTYLEGKRITQVPVEDGIVIRLARSGPNIQIRVGADGHEVIKSNLFNRAASPPAAEQVPPATHPSEDTLGKPGKLADESASSSSVVSGLPYSAKNYPSRS
ncbi:FHA domain-containing protein [Almyronema epifaneia]|uniref:FHA domain-containing protein n=1 Tax=Almyronema epifaneia S1 TaxID=2991925 RepID=A0ABW6IES8_9CYAN